MNTRRLDMIRAELASVLAPRADTCAGTKQITFEEFAQLQTQYAANCQAGTPPEKMEFLPVSTYAHKLAKIRPLLKCEVGVFRDGKIAVVKEVL